MDNEFIDQTEIKGIIKNEREFQIVSKKEIVAKKLIVK